MLVVPAAVLELPIARLPWPLARLNELVALTSHVPRARKATLVLDWGPADDRDRDQRAPRPQGLDHGSTNPARRPGNKRLFAF